MSATATASMSRGITLTVQHSVTLAKKALVVAALTLAAAGAASAPAWARTVVPCPDSSTVKLPGESPVANAPAHHGSPSLTVSSAKPYGFAAGSTVYEVHLTETNHTGAGYQHVTPVLGVFTRLGVMNTSNVSIEWAHGDQMVPLPTRPGCDPSVWVNSAALDGPLADGQSVTLDLYIKTPTAVAQKVESLHVFAAAGADGDTSPFSNDLTLPGLLDAGKPTGKPSVAPTTPAASTPVATVPPSSGTPTAAPSSATAEAKLASTGGGGNSGILAAGALALVAAGGAVLLGVKRHARRH